MRLYFVLATAVAALGLSGCKKNDYTIYALTDGGHVLTFNAGKSTTIDTDVQVTGLADTIALTQIFYRPSSKVLYCTTTDSQLCTLDPSSGVVTVINSGTTTFLPTDVVPSDTTKLSDPVAAIDPINDQVRIIGKVSQSDDLNVLVNPDTGVAATLKQAVLVFASGDANDIDGTTPDLRSIVYDPPISGAGSTTLFGIDETTGSLVRIGDEGAGSATSTASPSNGQLHTIAKLSEGFSYAALSIEAKNDDSYVALGTTSSSLYTIDLSSGALSLINTIGDGSWIVTSLAIQPDN